MTSQHPDGVVPVIAPDQLHTPYAHNNRAIGILIFPLTALVTAAEPAQEPALKEIMQRLPGLPYTL